MKKKFSILLFSILLFFTEGLQAQPWTYDFGTGTGTHPTNSISTTFLTSTPSGTYRVRTGSAGGTIVLANAGTSLGTATELQLQSATTTSSNKFGVYDWTSPSTTAYLKCKIRTTSSGNGNLNISFGINTIGNDNQGYTSHYNNSLASLTIAYTSGAISSVVRRISGSNTTITSSGFAKDTDQEIEIYANNSASSVSYTRGGTTYTLATRTWDCWLGGTRIVNNGATAGTLTAGTNLSGFGFFAEISASNAAYIYLDDLEYANALPRIYISDNGTQVAAANVNESTTAHILNKIKIDAVSGFNPDLTGMTCTTAGAYDAADITNLKVRYSTDATLDGGDATLSTLSSPGAAGSKTFPSFTSQTITGGTTGYIFITADIAASSASGGNTISVNALGSSNLTFSSGIKASATTAGGTQTIIATCTNPTIGTQPTTPQSACTATNRTFTIAASGTTLTYQWQDSISGGSWANITSGISGTFTYSGYTSVSLVASSSAAATRFFRCIVYSNGSCPVPSDTARFIVNDVPAQPGTITNAGTTVCQGQTGYTYSISAVSGATGYTWSYTGTGATITPSGTSATVDFSGSATSGNLTVTADNTCGSSTARTLGLTAISCTNTITTTTASYGPFCNASGNAISVAFTSTGTYTGDFFVQLSDASGSFPANSTSNLISSGTSTSPISATIPAAQAAGTGYRVRVVNQTPATQSGNDNGSDITVTAATTPSVSIAITTGTNPTCAGSSVTFTATPTNGGGSPTYQWKLNGSNIATGVTYTTTTLATSDVITCVMTTSATCTTAPTATSSGITMTVNPVVTPAVSITISTGATPTCTGNALIFTATPTNGGTPSYQWKLNGGNVGTNSTTYSNSSLADGSVISCVMTSTATCASPTTATSSGITITNNTPAQPTFTTSSTSVALGQTGVVYTVSNVSGVSYAWSYSGTGATITGAPSNSVTIDFSTSATSGNLTVTPSYLGCTGTARVIAITAAASNESNVVDNTPSYSSTTPEFNINPDYINFIDATSTTTGKMIPMKLKIQDGGNDLTDADKLNTILTGIKFTVRDHLAANQLAQIKTAILTTSGGTVIATASKVGTELVFSSMTGTNVTAIDVENGGSGDKIIHLRVSFDETQVIDNTKLVFQVSSVTAGSSSSTFAAADGGAAQSDNINANDRNRIEVTATKLNISTIADGFVATNLATFSITAADLYNRTDRDRTENVALSTSGTGMSSTSPYALIAGVVSISDVQYGSAQSVINITGTVSSPSITGFSNNFNINVITAVVGDYRTNPGVLPGDYVAFGSAAVGSVSGVRVWQTWNGTAWVDVTSTANAPEFVATIPPNIYINRGTNVDAASGRVYNNIYVDLEDDSYTFTSYSSTPGLSIATGKVLEIKKGTFQLGGILDLQGTSSLIIRKNATMEIQNTVTSTEFTRNASTTWEVEDTAFVFIDAYVPNAWTGTEIFHDESYFEITDWSNANPLFTGTGSSIISPTTVSGYSALFGNLSITIPSTGLSGNWTGMLPASVSFNLTHGDFDVINNETDNISLYSGNTSTIRIGRNMSVGGTGNFQMQTGAGTLTFTIDGNLVKNGTGNFRLHTFGSASAGNDVILNIDGNLTVNDGFFILSTASASGTSETVNLKGNLKKLLAGYMTQANSSGFANSSFNFTGTTTQTVDAVLQNTNDVLRYRFFIKSGAYVQIINQDWRFADQSRLTVEDGGTLDFGFNGTTALNLTETTSSATTLFALNQRGTLKITSPLGITAASSLTGNVQLDTRTYDQVATFWYIGKANQVTGNGITTASSAKVIICDLLDNNTTLTPSNQTGVSSTTTVDATYGGHLYIKKGQFRETTSAYITSSTGTLRMEQGTLYYIPKGSANATASNSDFIPRMSGGTYYLSGGTIEFAGSGSDAFQTLRGSRNYNKLKFSGANTYLTDYKNLSSNAVVDSSVEITNGSIVDCIDGSLNGKSFTGNGGLLMSGANSRLRIKKTGTTPQPELDGVNMSYNLSNGTVEFYGTLATEQQQLRGNYTVCTSCTKPKINYYNIDINAAAANLQTFSIAPTSTQLGNIGNVDVNESFLLTGTLNVNSPAVLRMDQNDFVDDGSGAGVVNINSGAGLLYANANGIKTSGTSVTDGNIRTSGTRTFSSGANYGFVSSGDMVSGNGLPTTVAGLYLYKTFSTNKVTLNNGGTTVNGILGLQKGRLVSSDPQKVILEVVSSSDIKSPANVGGVQDMGYDSSYVEGRMGHKSASTSEMIFPIGSSAKYGPLSLTPQDTTTQTYSCDYASSGYGTYTLDPANSPQLDHVSLVEYWNVTSTASGSNDDAKVKLFWRTHSVVGPSASEWNQLRVAHFDGTDWNTEGNSPTFHPTPSTAWGWVESNVYVPNFSPITLGTVTSLNPLPVELISFNGTCLGNGIAQINWSTATEINSREFVLQRSSDAIHFTTVAVLPAAGFSSQQKNYTVLDSTVTSNSNYYRLTEVDKDNTATNYSFILIECKEENSTNVFYNEPKVIVEVNSNTNKQVLFNVYEVSGKLLHQENIQLTRGYNRFNLDIDKKLSNGIYIIQSIDGDKINSSKIWVY